MDCFNLISNLNFWLSISIAYIIGSIPFAFLLIKKKLNKKITELGSGNVGAMNSYEVSGSKLIGILVFILDFIKGVAAVQISKYLGWGSFEIMLLTALFVVLGHNYSIFLKLKGGRGLATAAGAILVVNPFTLILWILMWIIAYYIIEKDIHLGNIFASLMSAILVFFAPYKFLSLINIHYYFDESEYKIFSSLICMLIFIKHINPLKELIERKRITKN